MASKRYAIWDKVTQVITPVGEVLTPEQWISRRPIAGVVTTVCAGGTINGAFFGVYEEMIDYYEKLGCDFSDCETEREHLDAIEAFEDAMNAAEDGGTSGGGDESSAYDELANAITEGVNEV